MSYVFITDQSDEDAASADFQQFEERLSEKLQDHAVVLREQDKLIRAIDTRSAIVGCTASLLFYELTSQQRDERNRLRDQCILGAIGVPQVV